MKGRKKKKKKKRLDSNQKEIDANVWFRTGSTQSLNNHFRLSRSAKLPISEKIHVIPGYKHYFPKHPTTVDSLSHLPIHVHYRVYALNFSISRYL